MGKSTTAITLDSNVLEEVKTLNINLSGEINEYLKGLINTHKKDVTGISIILLEKRKEKLIKTQSDVSSELRALTLQLEEYRKIKEKEEESRLVKEKEELEKKGKCMNCGNPILANSFGFPKGNVCKACYQSMSGAQFKEWSKTA